MYWDIGQHLCLFLMGMSLGILIIEVLNAAKQFTKDNEVYDFVLQPMYDNIFGANVIDDSEVLLGVLSVFGLLVPLTGIALWPFYITGFSLYYGLNHLRDINRLKKELSDKDCS